MVLRLASIVMVLFAGLAGARASMLSLYEHNLSVMDWVEVGTVVKVSYRTPRPGLAEAGIVAGTVLFEGNTENYRLMGTAYTFKRGCPPAPYEVIGEVSDSTIILRGAAPVRGGGCSVVGYSASSPHAVLVFKYISSIH